MNISSVNQHKCNKTNPRFGHFSLIKSGASGKLNIVINGDDLKRDNLVSFFLQTDNDSRMFEVGYSKAATELSALARDTGFNIHKHKNAQKVRDLARDVVENVIESKFDFVLRGTTGSLRDFLGKGPIRKLSTLVNGGVLERSANSHTAILIKSKPTDNPIVLMFSKLRQNIQRIFNPKSLPVKAY